jgi:hypothetical protein
MPALTAAKRKPSGRKSGERNGVEVIASFTLSSDARE